MIDENIIIIFEFNKIKTIIEASFDDSLQDIVNNYVKKEKLDINSLEFFLNNNKLNLNEKIQNLLDSLDKEQEDIIIQVNMTNDINNIIQEENFEIKCPKCLEHCRIQIKNYLIKLYDCKNGHEIENIELDEFKKIQKEISSLKKCEVCKKHNQILNFKRCINCKINLCPECISQHEKEHEILDYNKTNYICD